MRGEARQFRIHCHVIMTGEAYRFHAGGQTFGCIIQRRLGVETQQHLRALRGEQPGHGQRVVQLIAGRNQDAVAIAIDGAQIGPVQEFGARFQRHGHAVGDFEIMGGKGRAFVRAQEHAGVGDIGRRREGLGLGVLAHAAFQRHQVEEVIGGAAGIVALQLVHGGKHGANSFGRDRAGIELVHTDAARAKLARKALRKNVQRRLGHRVGRPAEIIGAAEDGGNIDDAATLAHRRSSSTHQVPGHYHDVAGGIAHRLAVGRAFQFFGQQRQIAQHLLGASRTGIVHKDIDAAMTGDDVGDPGAHGFNVGTVHGDDARRAAGGGTRSIQRGLGARGSAAAHHHGGTFGEVTAHDAAAQIAGGPGNQRHLAGKAALCFGLGHRGHSPCPFNDAQAS